MQRQPDNGGMLDSALRMERADIVVGIPSYKNVRTIAHVVRAVHAGLVKYFPQYTAVIVNSDGGSTDGTREAVLSTRVEDTHLLLLSHPLFPIHRLSMPYHGIPGKGSAFRLIFQVAERLRARACAVVDSDLRSITPEWIDLLVRPVLHAGYDFVAPYYHRHKYDGTITNSIVYPLTRALYGRRVRQPIGGDFGMSHHLVARYLERNDWESDVARYGIDIWMTTIAIAEGYRVCQSFLGAKLHDAKDPGADLSAMLHQVVGSVFRLMEEYEPVWRGVNESHDVDLFGFRFDVGLDPIEVNVDRMLQFFQRGCADLREVWQLALDPETFGEITALAPGATRSSFHIPDELWARVVYDFALAWRRRALDRGQLLRSLTPLYLGRVASFVIETQSLVSSEVEDRMEALCLAYEEWKPYLIENWASGPAAGGEDGAPPADPGEIAGDRAEEASAGVRVGGSTDVVDTAKDH
jgi:glucosylglycerate synthase